RFRIFHTVTLMQHVMTGGGQSIATQSAVVRRFIRGLTIRSKPYDDIAGFDVIDNDVLPFHPGKGRVPHVDRTDDISHIRCFTSSQMHPDMKLIESISKIFKKSDYFLNNFSRDEGFVSADRGGHYYVVQCPHTSHIVNIHHKRILSDPSPDGCVSGFLIP